MRHIINESTIEYYHRIELLPCGKLGMWALTQGYMQYEANLSIDMLLLLGVLLLGSPENYS